MLQQGIPEHIDDELTAAIGAGPDERTETRSHQGNASRYRLPSTLAGCIKRRIPKVGSGSGPVYRRCIGAGASGTRGRHGGRQVDALLR
jgi:hypothetical protein